MDEDESESDPDASSSKGAGACQLFWMLSSRPGASMPCFRHGQAIQARSRQLLVASCRESLLTQSKLQSDRTCDPANPPATRLSFKTLGSFSIQIWHLPAFPALVWLKSKDWIALHSDAVIPNAVQSDQ